MATGGAWQSETFDNGRDFRKGTAPPMGSGTPPAMYNPPPVGMSNGSSAFGVSILVLRIAQIVFALIASAIMGSNKDTVYTGYDEASSTSFFEIAKFNLIKSFVAVLAMNCIVCFYAIVQLVQSLVNVSTKGSFVSSPTTGFSMLTFIFDTVLAYALIAAAAAGADAASLTDCDLHSKFCGKANAAVAMTFLVFALLAVSAALYPVRLLRLTK